MGAVFCETHIDAVNKDDVKAQFERYTEHKRWLNGHGGYSGSMAEKSSCVIIPSDTPWDATDAYSHAETFNDKWDVNAYAYHLGGEEWYVAGWCSS